MSQEVLNIILGAVSVVVTGLASWAVAMFTKWLTGKMKDKKLAKMLCDITNIITDAVMNMYQAFVESLKANGKFDASAQKAVKEKCMEIIMGQLTGEMKAYIEENFGDIKAWISEKIETVIYQLKR